jgi:hypothetical protein
MTARAGAEPHMSRKPPQTGTIRVEVIHDCLVKLGFSPDWILSVMKYVTNVRYVLCVSGELTSPIVPSRGIWRGDPISVPTSLYSRACLVCCFARRMWGHYKESAMAVMVHLFFTSFSQMIAYFSLEVMLVVRKLGQVGW